MKNCEGEKEGGKTKKKEDDDDDVEKLIFVNDVAQKNNLVS